MTGEELRELDAWIAEHVMGWLFNRVGLAFSPTPGDDKTWIQEKAVPHYSTDPAAVMEVFKKCAEETDQISIVECVGTWAICEGDGNHRRPVVVAEGEAETLELAICLFAKKLFGGTNA